MIGTVEVRVSAGHPEMPVRPIAVVQGSAATIGVVDVPKTRCGATVTGVAVAIENADGTVAAVAATLKGGVWCATFGANHFATPGTVEGGLTITASGTAEDGTTQETWTIGKGDVDILSADGVPVPGETLQYVKLHDSVPTTPKVGDLAKVSGVWKIYTTTGWQAFGGGSGGTTDYTALENKPSIGGVELSGNKTLSDLGAVGTNDSRLTNSRTPTAHKSTHATGGADALSPSDIGAAAASHTHTKAQITDFGGPYLPISGGGTVSGYTAETGEPIGAEIVLDNESGGGGKVEIATGTQGEGGSISVKDGGIPGGASIKKGGKEVATEDQLPYASTSTPADRTCSTVTVASTGASVTIPKPSTDSKVTAFCVYLDMTALTGTAPTVGFKYSDNTDADILTRGGEGLSYETGAVNAVFFIQCGAKYIASAQTYKEASNG